jgi:hypothetical protein
VNLTWKDVLLWAANFAALVPLFAVLLAKRRALRFPAFTSYIGFSILESVTLFSVLKHQDLYARLYWTGQIIEVLLQIAVVIEIARHVFRPFGKWATGARSFWTAAVGVSLVAAAALTFVASPSAPSFAWLWVLKVNLFTVMFTCMISVAVLVTARRYGLAWRNHVIGLAEGWTFWAFTAFFIETCHSYYGYSPYYSYFEYAALLANVGVQIFWIRVFWQEEPSRVLSPERHNILIEQQKQLDYYVSKLVSRSGTRRTP